MSRHVREWRPTCAETLHCPRPACGTTVNGIAICMPCADRLGLPVNMTFGAPVYPTGAEGTRRGSLISTAVMFPILFGFLCIYIAT